MTMFQQVLIVGIGGAIGAALRFTIGLWLESSDFPWSTFIVNTIGSMALGLFTAYSLNANFSEQTVLFFSTGLLGAFTTMSAFSFETMNLLKNENHYTAMIYALSTFILCLIGAFLGWEIGGKLQT